jgi:hypothetical protein
MRNACNAVLTMNKRDFAKLIEGLENAAALAQVDATKATKRHVVPVVDARKTRKVLNLSRHQFAERRSGLRF